MDTLLKERLEVARIIAMERSPYWAIEISALVWVQASEAVEAFYASQGINFTMAVTYDWVAIVSPKIVDEWTAPETATVITHELMHLWQQHDRRARLLGIGMEDARAWNLSCDCEVNDDLKAAGWPFPKSHPGVFPSSYGFKDGMLAEQYFDLLIQLPRVKQPTSSGPGGAGGSTGGNDPQQPNAGQGACGSASGVPSPAEDLMDLPHPQRDEAEVEETVAGMAMAIEDYAQKNPGKVPAGLVLDAKRMRKRSRVDWRAPLRSTVRTAIASWAQGEGQNNWARLARRQFGDFIRPTQRRPQPLVAIVRDTSSSMSGLLDRMYPEIEAVMQETRAEILMLDVDCAAYDLRRVRSITEAEKYKMQGGGGTSFCPAFEKLLAMPKSKRPGVVVYITDGYGDAPENPPPNMKVVWAMLGGSRAPAPWGMVVHIEPPEAAA